MLYARLADLVLIVHLGFILFVVFGGFLVMSRPRIGWFHVPCLAYGAAIEIVGWICPLTPVEQALRRLAGGAGYEGGFIEHYVGRLVYPADWASLHVWLGAALVLLNAILYGWLAYRRVRGGEPDDPASP